MVESWVLLAHFRPNIRIGKRGEAFLFHLFFGDPGAMPKMLTEDSFAEESADAERFHRELFASAYADMRRIAVGCFGTERNDHTLTPTALVHEAWIRLRGLHLNRTVDQRYFYGCAARIMRQVLIDHARAHKALKRGGGCFRVPLDAVDLVATSDLQQIEILETAVAELERQDAELGEIVRLRFYAGLTSEQASSVMKLPLRTFKRRWSLARGFLKTTFEQMQEGVCQHDSR